MKDKVVVLMYHRVLDDPEVPDNIHPGMYVTRKVFETHLKYLSRAYHVITLEQLHEWLLGRQTLSGLPCVITFDDGWEDNYRNAFPLLRKFSLPATIFLITDQIGEERMLTWDHIHEMQLAGIAFGSHTVTHAILKGKDPEDMHRELNDSRIRLQKELSQPSGWFCYPKGEYDQAAYLHAKKHYTGALTTHRGVVGQGDDLFQLRRIGIHNDVSSTLPLFACRISTLL